MSLVSLTSVPASLNGIFCPGDPVVLICNVTALPTLAWYYANGSEITKFTPTVDVASPLRLSSTLLGVEILLISARQVAPMNDNFNMTSTFRGDASSIRSYFSGVTIRCGTLQTRDSVTVSVNITENGKYVSGVVQNPISCNSVSAWRVCYLAMYIGKGLHT